MTRRAFSPFIAAILLASAAVAAESVAASSRRVPGLGRARGQADGQRGREARRGLPRGSSWLEVSAPSRCPGADDFRLPFEFTAGVNDAGSSVSLGDGKLTWADRRRYGRCRSPTPRRRPARWSSPATVWSFRRARTSDTTATRPSTSRTRSFWCCATSRRMSIRTCAASSPATRGCATRRWRRASAEPRRSWWSRDRTPPTPARPSR